MKVTVVGAAVALLCSGAWAEPVLQNVVGTVVVNSKAAKVGDVVPSGASIQTGAGASRAEVRFDDGHLIALGASTQFQVRQYTYNKAEPAKDSILLNLVVGTLRSITGALGARNPGKFSLSTPTATAGIRGTDFGATVLEKPMATSWISQGVQVAALGDLPTGLADLPAGASSLELAQLPPLPGAFFTVNTGSIGVSTSIQSAIMGAGQSLAVGAGGSLSFVSAAVLPTGLQGMMSAPLSGGAAGAGAQSGAAGGGGGAGGGAGGASGGAGVSGGAGAGAGAGTAGAGAGATGAATGAVTSAGVAAAGAVVAGVLVTTTSTTGTAGTTGTTGTTSQQAQ